MTKRAGVIKGLFPGRWPRRAAVAGSSALPMTVVEPQGRRLSLGLGELKGYRELLFFLVWRDIKVRYRQASFGVVWAILQPLLLMLVFAVFLGDLAKVSSGDVPYPLFAYTALVPWTLFAQSIGTASDSLVRDANLVSKIYFPRLLIPVSAVGVFVFDFFFALIVLFGMMLAYGYEPSISALLLPGLFLLTVLTALAVGVWLSALNVRYRDIRYAVPLLVQLWLFASPVIYPSTLVPDEWQTLYHLNPIAGVVEGFRWALLGADTAPGSVMLVSAGATLALLIGGLVYFQRVQRTFADVI
jgi:lipopolysaccharide transport system permease protein